MAEERNLTITGQSSDATDTDATDTDTTKAELHQRMEKARESISHTVAEIKDTVTTKYEQISSDISRNLDWREHVTKNPLAFNLGALAVGFTAGFLLLGGGRSSGRNEHHAPRRLYTAANTDDALSTVSAEADHPKTSKPKKLKQGPSFFEKVKETETFHRLQDEALKLGDRFLDEMVVVGNEVVLPAVIAKLRELIDDLIPDEKPAAKSPETKAPSAAAPPPAPPAPPAAPTQANTDSAAEDNEDTHTRTKTNTIF